MPPHPATLLSISLATGSSDSESDTFAVRTADTGSSVPFAAGSCWFTAFWPSATSACTSPDATGTTSGYGEYVGEMAMGRCRGRQEIQVDSEEELERQTTEHCEGVNIVAHGRADRRDAGTWSDWRRRRRTRALTSTRDMDLWWLIHNIMDEWLCHQNYGHECSRNTTTLYGLGIYELLTEFVNAAFKNFSKTKG
ncbi:hypothetical protein F444_19442, partial [Phytophthora nicotianae P1976]